MTENDLEAYRQANNNLRHYSGLRFSILGAFVAISLGLFPFAVDKVKGKPAFAVLAVFILILAIAFSLLEWRINVIAEACAKTVKNLTLELRMSEKASELPGKSFLGRWGASFVVFVTYLGCAMIWIVSWIIP